MELLVSVLHNSHRHASRQIDAFSLQRGGRVSDQFRLEGGSRHALAMILANAVSVSDMSYASRQVNHMETA
ncbi:hypothetical protein [Rhodovarius sp.]|uniref:hypothetical protein n=1 Tax=Rhodovarius sp. TaxID=2972673 RepID=UPI003342A9BD